MGNSFTLNIAQNVTMLYDKTVVCSFPRNGQGTLGPYFCPPWQVSSEKLRRANMDPADWEKVIAAADRMNKSKLLHR